MMGDISRQVVAGILVALLTAAGSAVYAKFSPPEPKSGISYVVYAIGSGVNRTLGITQPERAALPAPIPAPVQADNASASVQTVSALPPPVAATQDTPFRSGDIFVSGFKAARSEGDVVLSFSVQNVSNKSILVAIDSSDLISAVSESGSASSDSIKGISRVILSEQAQRYFTELSPNSEIYVSGHFSGKRVKDSQANFNINLIQFANDKNIRYTFGRPVAIREN